MRPNGPHLFVTMGSLVNGRRSPEDSYPTVVIAIRTRKDTMGFRFAILVASLASLASGQETRGMIFGRVLDPSGAALAGAKVAVTNVETNVSTSLTANESGYFEANLLVSGKYRVVAEATGFKKGVRDGINLPVGAHIQVDMTLQLGDMAESVSVTSEAPLLDMNTAASGGNIENRTLMDVPIPSDSAMLMVKLSPGIQTTTTMTDSTSKLHSTASASAYITSGGVGGNEWSIDGTPNNGRDRKLAYVPAVETIQELKVDVGGFDATTGHTTGVNIVAMSKAGTNQLHGTLRELHSQGRWASVGFFRRQAYYRNIAAAEAAGDKALADKLRNTPQQPPQTDNQWAATIGGPVVLPKLFDGRNKLFFFFSHNGFETREKNFAQETVPTPANLRGDFSQLLLVDPVRYQIYDPLTVRPDPARKTHYVRDPLPGNILPPSRVVNPAYKSYVDLLPKENTPIDPKLEPVRNHIVYANPIQMHYKAWGNRVDYNFSDKHRFFGRWSWNRWMIEDYNSFGQGPVPEIALENTVRGNFGGMVDWVYTVNPSTILDVAVAANEYRGDSITYKEAAKYKPSKVGLPSYIDAKAGDRSTIPTMDVSGYLSVGWNAPTQVKNRFLSTKADLHHVSGNHTIRAGVDVRGQFKTSSNPGRNSGNFGFSNAYTRREDDSLTPAGTLGHSWAAFMMGLPNSLSIATNDDYATASPYYAWFIQENWRATRKLALNFGLRVEYEMGLTERYNRAIAYFDPKAKLPISDAAKAAYGARMIPELDAAKFVVEGGSLYPGVAGRSRRLWKSALMWLPRLAAAYQFTPKTVLRAGYGIFYDTLNATNEGLDQTGFSRTTSSIMTTDFGVNWLLGNPKAGISPLTDPFPVRGDGTRFDLPVRDALGLMARAGRGWTFTPYEREHARQQRWRLGIQRQFGNTVVEAAYAGSYSDRVEATRNLSYLPEQYWASGAERNNAIANNLNSNVPNPFYIENFASLQNSDPLVYADMRTNSFFTSSTIRKHQLLRAYPHMNGLSQRMPVGKVKTHEFNASLTRRFANGFNLNIGYSALYHRAATTFVNEFDPAPTWLPSNSTRPHRLTGTAVYEFPFGKGRHFLKSGILSHIFGGFQISLLYEHQPGALLSWGNLFYYGNLDAIRKSDPTLDAWFNTANFERASSKQPASFHRRVFPNYIDGVRAHSMRNWNGAIQRDFNFLERFTFQFRLDAMNLQNRSQFNAPNVSPTSTDFGRVTGANSLNRWIQIHGRLQF